METNNEKEYTLDFLGNEVRKGDLIYAIIHIRPDNLIKRKFVHAIIEDIRCGDVFANIDGIERRFNAGSFGWFKASEISKLHPKCTTCKHFFVSEFTGTLNCAKNPYTIIQDAQKYYCSKYRH